jgi:hypothetical protein
MLDTVERVKTRLAREKGTRPVLRVGLSTGLRGRPAACTLCRTPTRDGPIPPLLR